MGNSIIKHTIIEYADYAGEWAKLGAKISRTLFLEISSLEEEMIERIRERLRSGELLPTFRDLMYVSIAIEKAWQQAESEGVPETPGVTHEQYQATLAAAKERMKELKRLEAVG